MTDKKIIQAIRKGRNEIPIKQLYEDVLKIKKLILQSEGSNELAQEIFNESLVLLIEKIRNPKFELTSKKNMYLYGINSFLMKNALHK